MNKDKIKGVRVSKPIEKAINKKYGSFSAFVNAAIDRDFKVTKTEKIELRRRRK